MHWEFYISMLLYFEHVCHKFYYGMHGSNIHPSEQSMFWKKYTQFFNFPIMDVLFLSSVQVWHVTAYCNEFSLLILVLPFDPTQI